MPSRAATAETANRKRAEPFKSYYPCHVGTSFTCSDFLFHKKSVTRSTVPPLSQKGNAFSGALFMRFCLFRLFLLKMRLTPSVAAFFSMRTSIFYEHYSLFFRSFSVCFYLRFYIYFHLFIPLSPSATTARIYPKFRYILF